MRVVVGAVGLVLLLAVAAMEPLIVGFGLMLFAVLVFVLGVVGLMWPSLLRLPNRLVGIWVFAVAFGLFLGGGMLIDSADVPTTAGSGLTTPEERERRAEERRQSALYEPGTEPRRDVRGQDDRSGLTTPEERQRRAEERRRSGFFGPSTSVRRDIRELDPDLQPRGVGEGFQFQPRTTTNPCDVTPEEFGQMSPAEADRAWDACREIMGLNVPETGAAAYLRETADCLELTKSTILEQASQGTALGGRYAGLAIDSCASMEGLSAGVRRLAAEAMGRIDMTVVEQIQSVAGLDRALNDVIRQLKQQANRIE